MTTALNLEPAAKILSPPVYAAPRLLASRPVAVVAAAPAPVAGPTLMATRIEAATSSMDVMIQAIDEAVARMSEVLAQHGEMEEALAAMREQNEELLARAEAAEAAALRHEVRASEAIRKVEHLRARDHQRDEEQERLKASVDVLVAMFGGVEAMAAGG